MIKRFIVIIVLMSLIFSLLAQGLDLKIKRLEYIQQQIDQKRNEIERTQEEIDHLSRDKENYEQQYQTTQRKLDNLSAQERELSRELQASRRRMEQSESKLNETRELWEKQIYYFYLTHQKNGHSKDNIVDRQYFPIMINQTKEVIDENSDLLAHIKQNVEQTQRSQKRVQTERNRENQTVSGYRNEISNLNNQIVILEQQEQEINREFQELLQSRQSLENLITHFQSEQLDTQFSYQFTTSKLLWPVKGKVINNFGEIRDEYYNVILLNNGIDIEVDKPLEVKAVDFGVVVFAELFRNYGRLVIIDHHNGYFSLYANNGNLLVAKDDVVSLGQPIAITGRKNNSDSYMLHFELRRERTPVDPLTYLE
ncbi:MAG: peptidoglycan DD-metalloendopeptidase family protein [Candidatus Cloacimonetes bacterium]|nr:peptidoglycan DD-metalloendopeptidase family protein [Candidatus Cloacimonadota bacterium]